MNITDHIPRGIENAISQRDLSIATGKTPRENRAEIFNARCKGAVICSSCNTSGITGYYIPASPEEALPYVKMQHSRIKSARMALKGAERFVRNEGLNNG